MNPLEGIIEKSVIYRRKGELKEFEKRVNSASADICLRDASLLNDRGKLLMLARLQMMGMFSKKALPLKGVWYFTRYFNSKASEI